MSNLIPQPMTMQELLDVLDDIRDRVAEGDSLEGNIQYLAPQRLDYPPEIQFVVSGTYRIGNREGQGGVRMIGQVPGV